jgi:exodeoxyribonuclease-3
MRFGWQRRKSHRLPDTASALKTARTAKAAPMKIATFNINGIKARIEALPAWLTTAQPDVVCLQEIKSVDEAFPRELFEGMGYRVETHGQKSFNGVAILSKLPLEDVVRGLPDGEDDPQARWIEATVMGSRAVRVCGLYLPNGNPVEFDDAGQPIAAGKYGYKLSWMARMQARVKALLATEEPLVFCGDYNVIPQPMDAAKPEAWAQDALYLQPSRDAFRRLLNLGLTDAFRARNAQAGQYSFWDYQAGAWERNNGIRIDHLLLSAQAADLLRDCQIDKQVRAGDKPSDHVPVWIELQA